MRKYHDGERAHHGILAEIDSRDIPVVLNADHLAGDALVLAYVLASLSYRDAVAASRKRGQEYAQKQRYKSSGVESTAKLIWESAHRNLNERMRPGTELLYGRQHDR